MTTSDTPDGKTPTAPGLPARIRDRLQRPAATADAAVPVEGAAQASLLTRQGQRLRPFVERARGLGAAAAPAARRILPHAAKAGASLRAVASRLKIPAMPKGASRAQGAAGAVYGGLKATGLRIGSTLDAVVDRLPKKRVRHHAGKTAPAVTRHVPTFDATPPEQIEERPSVFAPGTLATAVVSAGLIHLVTTFAIPMLGTGSAYTALKPALPVNRMVVFPPQAPGRQILPFIAPDMLYAICRFDISANPMVVKALLPGIGWSLTLYTPAGDNFYAQPGTAQGPVDVSFMMVPPTERLLEMMPGARREDIKLNQIVAPTREGLIVVRGPIKANALVEETKRELGESACKPSELAAPLR